MQCKCRYCYQFDPLTYEPIRYVWADIHVSYCRMLHMWRRFELGHYVGVYYSMWRAINAN